MLPDNIYFILGVPCTGKTTLAKLLAPKHGLRYFSGDEVHFHYFKQANEKDHTAMSRNMSDFFDLSLPFLIQYERDVMTEQTPMILADLVRLSLEHERVLFDGILDLALLRPQVAKNRIVYVTVSRDIRARDFFARDDHKGMLQSIYNTAGITEAEKERRIALRKNAAISFCVEDARAYDICQVTRDDHTKTEEMLAFVERHFALC